MAKLRASMSVEEFDDGYFYAAVHRVLALPEFRVKPGSTGGVGGKRQVVSDSPLR